MTHMIGYARVSSPSQNLDAQIDNLKDAGCARIFTDTISGTKTPRKGWEELMSYIRSGDVLVITELSRMSRSLSHLLGIVEDLKVRQVEFKSLRENIDTSSATGRAFLSIMGAVSQMELEIKSERAEAGRAAAKARGKSGGRPAIDQDKLEQARILYQNSDKSARVVCSLFGFSRRTLFEHIRKIQQSKDAKG
ncbi:MAG: recombinase family protein [Nitrososphaera sp.]|nr:recombinase family protein [Nitrososphaera sp.]